MQVHFTAPKSVSFTAKIDFFDGEGNVFCLPVSGTSENSILTVYPYISPRLGSGGFDKYLSCFLSTTFIFLALFLLSF